MSFLSPIWALPFLGIILSMAFLPLVTPKLWNKYSSYVSLVWVAIYLVCVWSNFGLHMTVPAVVEPIVSDYIPFIILISSLYIIAGGIYIEFPRGYGPVFNVILLFLGGIVAGWIGTTGAAMLLIRPFLRANANRKYKTHLMVFFIFIVANIGGAASPLGDPPLFIGFLKGVDFFWFIKNLYPFIFGTITCLCMIFFMIDMILFKLYDSGTVKANRADELWIIKGKINLLLISAVCVTVAFCSFDGGCKICGEYIGYASMTRNIILLLLGGISLYVTPETVRQENNFNFDAVREIAELFAGIFITVTPIIEILHQGGNGAFAPIFSWIAPSGEFLADRAFWASGLLSSFLDNAPTFLIFFHLMAGNATILMTSKAYLLSAISISTVFMGAVTYIGNAPNLMVKTVSSSFGINTPSFLGYMVWSVGILFPIFFIISCFLR